MGKDSEVLWEIWRGLSSQELPSWLLLDTKKSMFPVTVAIRLLTADPYLEITKDKVKSKQRACKRSSNTRAEGRKYGWRSLLDLDMRNGSAIGAKS